MKKVQRTALLLPVDNPAALLLPCSFAQVVMWLEALAAQKLPDPLRDASCRFTSQDGVWRETLRALGGPGHHTAAGAGSELDPDAVSRDQLKLAVANQENDKKLAAWAWRLVRAGATPGIQCHGSVHSVLVSYFMGGSTPYEALQQSSLARVQHAHAPT